MGKNQKRSGYFIQMNNHSLKDALDCFLTKNGVLSGFATIGKALSVGKRYLDKGCKSFKILDNNLKELADISKKDTTIMNNEELLRNIQKSESRLILAEKLKGLD